MLQLRPTCALLNQRVISAASSPYSRQDSAVADRLVNCGRASQETSTLKSRQPESVHRTVNRPSSLTHPLLRRSLHTHTKPGYNSGTRTRAEAAAARSDSPENNHLQNSSNKSGVLSALQGVKAENSLVLAVFLKILLLGSSGSLVAVRLAQTGFGHTVGRLQGLSLIPVAVGLLLFTRYVLKKQLHLRRGFQQGFLVGGIVLLVLSNRYSAMQRKYAVVPSPPVATAAPRVSQEQYSRLRALPTAEDADEAFTSHFGDNAEKDWEWRNRR